MSDKDKPAPGDPQNRTDLVRPRKPGTFVPGDPRINKGGRPKGIGGKLREIFGDDGEALVEWGLKVINGEVSIEQVEMLRTAEGSEPVDVIDIVVH